MAKLKATRPQYLKEALKQEAAEMANVLKSDLEGLLALFPESEGSASVMAMRVSIVIGLAFCFVTDANNAPQPR